MVNSARVPRLRNEGWRVEGGEGCCAMEGYSGYYAPKNRTDEESARLSNISRAVTGGWATIWESSEELGQSLDDIKIKAGNGERSGVLNVGQQEVRESRVSHELI